MTLSSDIVSAHALLCRLEPLLGVPGLGRFRVNWLPVGVRR
jgi:hypothetical protein